MAARLRLLVLVAGLVCAMVAWHRWNAGSPPLWSFAAPRAETVVTRAQLVGTAGFDGSERRHPVIEVAWPPGAATAVELPGLVSPHQRWKAPFALVRDHPPGTPMTVRVVGGRPVADRLDLYELAYAVLFTLSAIGLTAGGALLILRRLFRRDRNGETAA